MRLLGRGRLPEPRLMIAQGYWRCERCRSLYGGIKGKGPTRAFWGTPNAQTRCRHEWAAIDRDAFLREASDRFGKNWDDDLPFFRDAQRQT